MYAYACVCTHVCICVCACSSVCACVCKINYHVSAKKNLPEVGFENVRTEQFHKFHFIFPPSSDLTRDMCQA